MKIVNNEEGRVDMHSKAMKITYNSVVRMLDSGGSGKLKVWEGKITGKPVPARDLEPSVYK